MNISKKDQILNLLGLATRARKIKTGEEIVISEIRRGNVKLVILSEDAAANVTKNIKNKMCNLSCNTFNICYTLWIRLRNWKRKQSGVA